MTESANQQSELIEVALFPIPDVVAFPGVDLPLHVFEPRYRQLVHDCVEDNRMIGVCHTLKAIHRPSSQQTTRPTTEQTLEKMLNTNQTTYKPQPVFSAGYCEILETLDDGRILANVCISVRLELIEERQSLPYRIALCKPLPDTGLVDIEPPGQRKNDSSVGSINESLQAKIHERLIALIEQENEDLAGELRAPAWTQISPAEYSFRIFSCLRFEADVMQHILETRSARDRLRTLWQLLQGAADDR